MRFKFPVAVVAMLVVLGGVLPVAAQWQTQSILVKPGWTAIYLHVDPSYNSLDQLVGSDPNNPISDVWLWEAAVGTAQYVTGQQATINDGSGWVTWTRGGVNPSLGNLIPNAAYLIHSTSTTNYTWTIKGKPTAPSYAWTTTGMNLIGFPTVTGNPPDFNRFLNPVPALNNAVSAGDITRYTGGELDANNVNPTQIAFLSTVKVTRGQAFWIRTGNYFNNYFGPFTVSIDRGIDFGDSTSRTSFHLVNPTINPVTVTLNVLSSETAPAGQTPILGLPPLVVRGALNATNLTYAASSLTPSTSVQWTLAPQGQAGSDIIVNLGIDRTRFANVAPGLYGGILKFTDSLGFTEVDVPVSAQPAAYTGLWVGSASVGQVANYLKIYQRDINNNPVQGSNGAYQVTGVNTNLGAVSTPFPMRLILHNDGTNVALLQRVFAGVDVYSNAVLATSESVLDPSQLSNARRITAVQFPWTPTNQTWSCAGQLIPGGTLSTTVDLPYDDQSSNPFLHTYHPDHNNLDATYKNELPIGSESYRITRQINMSLNSVGSDYGTLTQFSQSVSGNYTETITVTGLNAAARTFNVAGGFALTRISSIAKLTRP